LIPFTPAFHKAGIVFRVSRQLRMLEGLEVDRQGMLLDVGIGDGPGLAARLAMGFAVVGIDKDSQRLRRLKEKFPRVHVVVADASALPFREDTFVVALASQVLEHLNNPEQTVKEVYRLLRPGGYFLLDVPWLYELYRGVSAFLLRQLQASRRAETPTRFFRAFWRFREGRITRMKHTQLVLRLLGMLKPLSWMRSEGRGEQLIAEYLRGVVPEGHLHLRFHSPGEWTKMIRSCGFSVIKRSGAWITPLLLDRSEFFNQLFGKIERILPDPLLSAFGQKLIIEARKPP
jgi:SAM-dependent methyltransferase